MHDWVNDNFPFIFPCRGDLSRGDLSRGDLSRPYRVKKIILLVFCYLFSAQNQAGEFSAQIKTASLEQQNGWYVLNAELDYVLSPTAKEAIQSSIPLTWCLKIQLKKIRYLRDKTLVKQEYCYKIRYHALLNNYSVTNETTQVRKKYDSLPETLDSLSRLSEIKLIAASALRKNKTYNLIIKLDFDKEQLPAPLRSVAYFNSDWDLSSDWYLWQLEQ